MPVEKEEKALLRQEIRKKTAALPLADKTASDKDLLARFLAEPAVERAETILLFYGVGIEPETAGLFAPLWKRGKRLLLPCCLPQRQMLARVVTDLAQTVPDRMGIPTPTQDCVPLERTEIDLILVPALCYDRQGYRLGQGGGYYDRYLADYHGTTLGLCRRALLQDAVPREAHDLPVERVIAEEETLVP